MPLNAIIWRNQARMRQIWRQYYQELKLNLCAVVVGPAKIVTDDSNASKPRKDREACGNSFVDVQ